MPDDTTNDINNNQQNPTPTASDTPPPVFSEDIVPPMTQQQDQTQFPPSNDINSAIPEEKKEENGSAAPIDDINLTTISTPPPKKKFAGGKMIATILGLFLLVGGASAGLILVKQQQDVREKAASGGDCIAEGRTCINDTQCCTLHCINNDGLKTCMCLNNGSTCSLDKECCTGLCNKGKCSECTLGVGDLCSNSDDCCVNDLVCGTSGRCERPSTPKPTSSPVSCDRELNQRCGDVDGCCSSPLVCTDGYCKAPVCDRELNQRCGDVDGCCAPTLVCTNGYCKLSRTSSPSCPLGTKPGSMVDINTVIKTNDYADVCKNSCGGTGANFVGFKFTCPNKTSGSCQENEKKVGLGLNQSLGFNTSFCGLQQIDLYCADASGNLTSQTYVAFATTYKACSSTPTSPPPTTPPPTTPPPFPESGMCIEIKIFDDKWVEIKNLTKVIAGQQVYLAVRGDVKVPQSLIQTPTHGRFRINEKAWMYEDGVHVDRINSITYFYVSWTIPSDTYDFAVDAEVYHPRFGWF